MFAINSVCEEKNSESCAKYGFHVEVNLDDNDIRKIIKLIQMKENEDILQIKKHKNKKSSVVVTGYRVDNKKVYSAGRNIDLSLENSRWELGFIGQWFN